ncbi:MAG: hypothetical protein ACRC7G_10000 [Beijerinckiaceae bacterium]
MSGKWVSLSLPRRIIADMCQFSLGVPRGVIKRRMNIVQAMQARANAAERIAWPVLFLKAYALVARDMPVFRQAYVKLPWPHLYEHGSSVASLVIERDHDGEAALLLARIKQPEILSLLELDQTVRRLKEAPAQEVRDFRRALLVARLPLPIRRVLWWLGLNIGRHRAGHYGTFAISVLGSQGVEIVHAVSLWTLLLSYGPISADGDVEVTVSFDHRVMDGGAVARMLAALEMTVNGAVATEIDATGQPV